MRFLLAGPCIWHFAGTGTKTTAKVQVTLDLSRTVRLEPLQCILGQHRTPQKSPTGRSFVRGLLPAFAFSKIGQFVRLCLQHQSSPSVWQAASVPPRSWEELCDPVDLVGSRLGQEQQRPLLRSICICSGDVGKGRPPPFPIKCCCTTRYRPLA